MSSLLSARKLVPGPKEDEYFVYSCGSSTIFINRLNYSKEPAYDFDDFANLPSHLESNKRTYAEINWKPDFSYLLIGSYRGFIDLYNDELVFLNRYSVEIKNVECLTWHPKRTYESPDRSPLEFWFAACGNDADIYLFNSTKTCVKQSQGEDDSKEWESKRLVGHKKRVVRVCWSQHNDGFLASASKDGSVLIWNACTGVILASYLCHQDNVLAVQWSVTDHDVIYSAGEDSCVRVWKISEQAVINPSSEGPPKRRLRRRHRNNNAKQLIRKAEISVEAENGEPLESTILIDGDEHNPNDENDDEDFPTVETRDINSKGLPVSGKKTLTETDRKQLRAQGLSRKGLPQLFPFHSLMSDASIENELKDCLQLADALKAKKNVPSDETQIFDLSEHSVNTLADEDILKLGPFMDQMTALKMLEVQAENFKLLKTFRHFCHLSVMSSNVKALIEYAAANKKLSTFHVSLAPSVSYSYWFEVCEKYAKQLIEAHQYNQACMYLLVCNKVNEAIDIWADKIDVIEALVLAKARLPESDPKIRTLLHRARKRYVSHYNQARIAKCLLALDQPFTAAKTLFFVSDPKFMKAGIYIAKLYELDDVAKKYVYFYMVKCLSIDDWNALTELVNEEPSMKWHGSSGSGVPAQVLASSLDEDLKLQENLEEEILFQPNSSKPVKFWIGSTCMESKESFIKHVYRILLSNNLLPSKTDEIFDILKVLGNMFAKKTYDCEIQLNDEALTLDSSLSIICCVIETGDSRTIQNVIIIVKMELEFIEDCTLTS
ncbi:gem-associated protein 5 [Trichonephila clavipes]|nr:gem-associated protein 5 [Trichonephila clavipes]